MPHARTSVDVEGDRGWVMSKKTGSYVTKLRCMSRTFFMLENVTEVDIEVHLCVNLRDLANGPVHFQYDVILNINLAKEIYLYILSMLWLIKACCFEQNKPQCRVHSAQCRGLAHCIHRNQTEVQVEAAKVQNLGQMSPRLTSKFSSMPTSMTIWPILTKVLEPSQLDFHLRLISYECSLPAPCQNFGWLCPTKQANILYGWMDII